MAKVQFELHPRDTEGTCHIIVDGKLVEKCDAKVKVERLAAYGKILKNRGGYQSSSKKGQ